MGNPLSEVRISSSAQKQSLKVASIAAFVVNKLYSDKTVPRLYYYRAPKVGRSVNKKTGKEILYIEYYYRIPVDLRPHYKDKKWKRFREKHDINRRKGQEREIYADWLRNEIERTLKAGFDPFAIISDELITDKTTEKSELNATDALKLFLDTWELAGLDKYSFAKYKTVINRLIDWLQRKKIPYINVEEITQSHIENFLQDMKKEHGFSNRVYNNYLGFTRTAFNFFIKKKFISETPCNGISKMKAKTTKHKYYDQKSLNDIIRAMTVYDPYVLLAFQSVYYLCLRSDKEMMQLKVGNIKWEENKVLSFTKGNSERYIPMDENIKDIWLKHGINNYPGDHYIFGIEGKPSEKHFGKGFFSKRFRKVRDAAGLSKDYTLYGAKPTRIVHLKMDNVPDADIMSLTGHKDFTSYSIYLRGLGLTADIKNINAKSRKI